MGSHNKNNRSSRFAALTSAALTLPAIAQLAQAESPPDKTEFGYRYSQYQEDDIDAGKVISGSNERYTVDNHQFRLETPVADDMTLTLDAAYETMSGASTYGTIKNPEGQTQLIMSGASIDEKRTDLLVGVRKKHNDDALIGTLGYSSENDFVAYNGAIEFEQLSADRTTTWSGGIGFSMDKLEPEQTPGINRTTSEDKWSVNGFIAAARVLSPVWQVQGGVFTALHDGYLADPYKAIDVRPDQRQTWGFTGLSRYFIKSMQAAVHTDYRYYSDDWGIEAHTLELSWHQSVGDTIRVVPMVRYYSQSQADFYVESDSPFNAGYQSSDFRLSPFGALSYGASVILEQPSYRIILHGEQYDSDGNLALKNVTVENPALVSYTLFTIGFDYSF